MQVFLEHVPTFTGEYHIDKEIFEKARHLSCTQLSEKWLAGLSSKDEMQLFANEYGFYGVSIKHSFIGHPFSDMRCIANHAFTEENKVCYYCGTQV